MSLQEFQALCIWTGFLVCVATYGGLLILAVRWRWLRVALTVLLIVALAHGVIVANEALIRPNLDCDVIPWWLRLIEPACW